MVASAKTGIIGETVTLTATPDEGYRFKEWEKVSGDGTIEGDRLTIGTSEYPVGVFFSNQIAELNIPYFSIIVTERSIAQALYDFMMYLPTSNFVHDQQETLAVLQQCLNETFKGE